ncbi:hypothetical protein JX265_009846 [Neoarthrinium moseri]|uniref:Apple domain-containing protein n=1 Tax=Neoarthrinium moseri TaxID=1658444 RepID=A0A9Q0AM41_9PEZI|nr:hypothetical protein JX265_009846 [Neoarthrinium moseri]
MKLVPFGASIGLLHLQAVLAQSTGTSAATSTATSTASASSCTASLITTLCSYKEPGPEFAVASGSRASCWNYCNAHSPCSFVIFSAGNPYTGTGTCWLYPGESFDASAGSSDCGNPSLSVYSQPVCAGGSATTTSGTCAATATPSAVASICGYPTPPDNCFDGCTASLGATDCLSQCAKAASCSYVVFNPDNPSNSPYASGSCWMYPNGTYDAGLATTCSGKPEQFVYDNLCPKPSPTSSSALSSTTATNTGTATTAGGSDSTTTSQNAAPTGLSHRSSLALGLGLSLWLGLE